MKVITDDENIQDNPNFLFQNNNNTKKSIKKEEILQNEVIRPIQIDLKMASKQKKLNILGIEVFFPYEPYENQILYMKKVIQTLQTKGMAGLESPTGTGKTLCLLCATLAYLKHIREELLIKKNENNEMNKERQPVIYYTSRTHAQINNVIKELRKTVYRPINAVISSREQSCVNEYINHLRGGILNLKCKYAKKKGECKYYRVQMNNKGYSAYDGLTVDELKIKGKSHKFCPYFFEKDKSKNSDIIFLPYNYIFDMKVLYRSKLILNNSILIIDEAHNLQDICCDSVSIDLNTNVIEEIINDLKSLKIYFEELESFGQRSSNNNGGGGDNIKAGDLKYEIHILNTLKERIMNIKLENKNVKNGQNPGIKIDPKTFFDLMFKSYKGNQTTLYFGPEQNTEINIKQNELNKEPKNDESNDDDLSELNPKNIPKHISFLKDVEYFINNDRGKGTLISIYNDFLEILSFLSSNYYDKESQKDSLNLYVNSFRFYVEEEREIKQDSGNKKKKKFSFSNAKVIKRILHIYCFNPGVGFKAVMSQNFYSTIITSGTLSPIDSMESELKQNFNYKLENTHVIGDSQFNFCVLTSSPFNNVEFNFNVENRLNIEMIYQLGLTILEFCKFTPGGILIFFTSYTIMDRYIAEWTEKNIISEISKYKEFYHDRRDSKQNKLILEKYQMSNSDRNKYKGGVLLSVCRGSCSEGMNFKDDMARMVIVIGIPYAMLYDPKIQLKKEFQDDFNKLMLKDEKNKNIKRLSGSEWYSQNAIKCVNQSLGRVIRHSNDYGAMILIDTRYQYIVRKNYISLWMRNKCKIFNKNNNKSFFDDMKKFFENVEDYIKNKKLNQQKNVLNNSPLKNISLSKKSIEKNSKILKEKMNELENSKSEESPEKFIIYHSKKIKVNEIKIQPQNNNTEQTPNQEIKEENKDKDKSLEGINLIDESFFEKLSESVEPKKKEEEIESNKEELSDKELIEEFMKKKNDKKFIEELEKKGLEVKENSNNEEEKETRNKLSCIVCFSNTEDSEIKLEVGKCGHILCHNCWSKIEDKKGNSKCPICRKNVKKKDRNLIYLN